MRVEIEEDDELEVIQEEVVEVPQELEEEELKEDDDEEQDMDWLPEKSNPRGDITVRQKEEILQIIEQHSNYYYYYYSLYSSVKLDKRTYRRKPSTNTTNDYSIFIILKPQTNHS